jgi:hypothetical protein
MLLAVLTQAVKTTEAPTTTQEVQAPQEGSQEIYIGFPKGDYAPRTGRKGRFIKDDPKKYPAKENVGFLPGATGEQQVPCGKIRLSQSL